eukprot:gnl/Spiro4/975_TR519_c0_g1_i1.p1 gnl/Spiro4/975_TR519_c0_g1~~gnl/Spiro4/975_TR519_c0_g1_i1.p1  ORF type:complete len:273 (-),score=76.77 gnl/Spiro4/975_TR519_c0_g1_i1:75-866(-)
MENEREVAEIEATLIIAKNAHRAACAQVIEDITTSPYVFVFGEILALPNIVELESIPELRPHFELLKIFCYGTLSDYRRQKAALHLPDLKPAQERKLTMLSLVSLSLSSKILRYDDLLRELNISNVRDLEDLIIDSIYTGLIRGVLDQSERRLEVTFARSRDVQPTQIGSMLNLLKNWKSNCTRVLEMIDAQIQYAQRCGTKHRNHCQDIESRAEAIRIDLLAKAEEDAARAQTAGGHGGFGSDMDMIAQQQMLLAAHMAHRH